jgi:hypothetical protein
MRDRLKNPSQHLRVIILSIRINFLHRRYQRFMHWHAGNGMEGFLSLTNRFRKGGENTITVRRFNNGEGLYSTNLEWR